MAKFIFQAGVFTGEPLFPASAGSTSISVIDKDTLALAPLWTDRDGLFPESNPHFVDSSGQIEFYANAGRYDITATSGALSKTWRDVLIVDPNAIVGGTTWGGITGTLADQADLAAALDAASASVATVSDILAGNFSARDLVRTAGFAAIDDGLGGAWYLTGNVGTPSTTDYANGLIYDLTGAEFKKTEVRGGAFIVFDDANAVTKSDLMPLAVTAGFKAGLAMYLSGLAASYAVVRLEEAATFVKSVDGEVLNHSSNSVGLDAAVDLTYGETLIRTAKDRLTQYGFPISGFVAPNSTLDAKFVPELKRTHDFAFVRSVGATTSRLSVNRPEDDRYNLVRVSLEAITEIQAQALVDYAIATDSYVVFYTHIDTGFVDTLMSYIQASVLPDKTPTEWIGGNTGIAHVRQPSPTGNCHINSRFLRINSTDTAPYLWGVNLSALDSAAISYSLGEQGSVLDITSGAGNLGGEQGVISQNFFISPVKDYTAYTASINARSLASSNTQLKVSVYAKAGAATISTATKTYDISGNEQRIYATLGVIPDATLDRILVEYTIIAVGAGAIRAIISAPQLERSGYPTAYSPRGIDDPYYSVMRRVTGLTVSSATDTVIIFDASLEGTNYAYDTVTGVWSTDDDRLYSLNVNVGLAGMIAGNVIQLQLQIDGVVQRKQDHVCAAGTNLLNTSFKVRGDDRDYQISIRHDSGAGRALTTFGNATLTISSEGLPR